MHKATQHAALEQEMTMTHLTQRAAQNSLGVSVEGSAAATQAQHSPRADVWAHMQQHCWSSHELDTEVPQQHRQGCAYRGTASTASSAHLVMCSVCLPAHPLCQTRAGHRLGSMLIGSSASTGQAKLCPDQEMPGGQQALVLSNTAGLSVQGRTQMVRSAHHAQPASRRRYLQTKTVSLSQK